MEGNFDERQIGISIAADERAIPISLALFSRSCLAVHKVMQNLSGITETSAAGVVFLSTFFQVNSTSEFLALLGHLNFIEFTMVADKGSSLSIDEIMGRMSVEMEENLLMSKILGNH